MARKESQLILNPDQSIYHLHLKQEDIAPWVITVGDPGRVERVAKHLDEIHFKKQKREFISCRGRLGDKVMLILSSGIGPDNIDIVMNEIDALANVDFTTGLETGKPRQLTFIRLGTTGALQADLPVDAPVASTHAVGLDNLLHFYEVDNSPREDEIREMLQSFFDENGLDLSFYLYEADQSLVDALSADVRSGITLTCPGFYGPQGRRLRMPPRYPALLDTLRKWSGDGGLRITNLEMESAAIFGLARGMGHRAIAISAVIANREAETFSTDPYAAVDHLIVQAMEWIDGLPGQD